MKFIIETTPNYKMEYVHRVDETIYAIYIHLSRREKGGCKGIQVSKLILMAQRDKEKELHFNINIDKEEGITQKVRCNRKS